MTLPYNKKNENKFDRWLKIINSCTSNSKEQSIYSGLADGKCGLVLLAAQLYQLSNNHHYYRNIVYRVTDSLLDKIETNNNYSLGYGIAGVAWTIDKIKDYNFFSDLDDWFYDTDSILANEYFRNLDAGNIDYYEGAMGILFYFLDKEYYSKNKLDSYILSFCNYISTCSQKEDWIESKYNHKKNKYYDAINLGVPHGITGVLLILLLIKEKRGTAIDAEIEMIVELLLSFEIKHSPYHCHFPLTYGKDNIESQKFSTIGWCYGDLMAGYAIYKAGIVLRNKEYAYYGMKILIETVDRENHFKEKLVLCHGFTSMSYIYRHIYNITGNNIFKTRSLYSQRQAIDLFFLRYKKYKEGIVDSFFEDTSLFAGYTGYFLSLITWYTNDDKMNNWLSCLLL